MPAVLRIGRNSDCEWRVPEELKRVSHYHARLSRVREGIVIEDTDSANGVICQGQNIRRKVLTEGDRFLLADCVLSVGTSVEVQPVAGARLIGLMGEYRGQVFPIVQSPCTVGSAEACDVRIGSVRTALVSKQHAQLTRKPDGSFWITDMSSYGTWVNEERLEPQVESPLRHGDHVFLCDVGLIFDDGRGVFTTRHLYLLVGSVLSVLLVCLGVLAFIYRKSPGSEVKEGSAQQGRWPYVQELVHRARVFLGEGPKQDQSHGDVEVLSGLSAASNECEKACLLLKELRTTEVLKMELTLPPEEACEGSSMDMRRTLVVNFAAITNCAQAVADLQALSSSNELCDVDKVLLCWQDKQALDRALTPDPTKRVSRDRQAPASDYDRYFGVEDYYTFWRRKSHIPSARPWLNNPFLTVMGASLALLPDVERALQRWNASPSSLQKEESPLRNMMRKCEAFKAEIKAVVEDMRKQSNGYERRRAMIATGVACQLDVDGQASCDPKLRSFLTEIDVLLPKPEG